MGFELAKKQNSVFVMNEKWTSSFLRNKNFHQQAALWCNVFQYIFWSKVIKFKLISTKSTLIFTIFEAKKSTRVDFSLKYSIHMAWWFWCQSQRFRSHSMPKATALYFFREGQQKGKSTCCKIFGLTHSAAIVITLGFAWRGNWWGASGVYLHII